MKTFAMLLLVVVCSTTFSWGQDELVVKARLMEIPGTMPPNDLYNYVFVLKYKVIKVIKGELDAKEILVGQYNPLLARSAVRDKMDEKVNGNVQKFKAGDEHVLTLVAPLEDVWNGAVEDEYFDDESTRYFATVTDKATGDSNADNTKKVNKTEKVK